MADTYIAKLCAREPFCRPLKIVLACGNGTAGAFAPKIFERLGAKIEPLHCKLDYNFPHYNPNPEHMKMLHDVRDKVLETKADIGFAFDGDGDRCGVVDDKGDEIFADKIGVLLARNLSAQKKGAVFIADIKSTGLYQTDPILKEHKAKTIYHKTGHSYMKRALKDEGALAGFEKSGHYFFAPPLGLGYDDGMLAGIMVANLLCAYPNETMASLAGSLPQTWSSPTMSVQCADDKKYDIVENITAHFEAMYKAQRTILGQNIKDILTINGVRVLLEDGVWGLVRASSNTPNLVVVTESPNTKAQMKHMFGHLQSLLASYGLTDYDQKL